MISTVFSLQNHTTVTFHHAARHGMIASEAPDWAGAKGYAEVSDSQWKAGRVTNEAVFQIEMVDSSIGGIH